jgi:hypothetical protein
MVVSIALQLASAASSLSSVFDSAEIRMRYTFVNWKYDVAKGSSNIPAKA